MSCSRRKFLRSGTLVALCAGVPLKALFAETFNQSASTPGPSLAGRSHLEAVSHLDRTTFARFLNTRFSLHHGKTNGDVKLVEVSDWTPDSARRSAAATGRECFSAVFLGSLDAPLRQETYTVKHESLGTFPLLVVPVGRGSKGLYYEALFNRLY